MGKICRRLHLNYRAKIAHAGKIGIDISFLQSNIFIEYIQKISISGECLTSNGFIVGNSMNIKHFRVYGFLPEGGFECIEEILKGVEVLEMNECFIVGEFFDNYLRYCPKVRTLSVSRFTFMQDKSVIMGSGNDWLLRIYPTLENFELIDSEMNTNELNEFFQPNSNIQTFSTDAKTLWLN